MVNKEVYIIIIIIILCICDEFTAWWVVAPPFTDSTHVECSWIMQQPWQMWPIIIIISC